MPVAIDHEPGHASGRLSPTQFVFDFFIGQIFQELQDGAMAACVDEDGALAVMLGWPGACVSRAGEATNIGMGAGPDRLELLLTRHAVGQLLSQAVTASRIAAGLWGSEVAKPVNHRRRPRMVILKKTLVI